MANHKVIYAKCPYCKTEQPWATQAASNQFSDGTEHTVCPRCGSKMVITATEIMRFTAKKLKGE
jgi:DNA-directed RNA polymerase subunit RPC12/RpoP